MINARSSYYVVKQATNLTQVDLAIQVNATGVQHNTVATAQYSLTATPVTTDAGGSQPFALVDISALIRDYIKNEFDGTYTSNPVWVCYQLTRYISGTPTAETIVQLKAFDGYGYFEEGTQSSVSGDGYTAPDVLQSNTIIYKSDDEIVRIPVLQDNTPTVTFYCKGVETNSETISVVDDTESIIRYIDNSGASFPKYSARVSNDSGTLEEEALGDIFMRYSVTPCDKIIVTTSSDTYYYDVRDIKECKYKPYKLVFVNKFGAYQDLWFFKRSSLSMSTKEESYMSNTLDRGSTSFSITSDYPTTTHQKRVFNKTGAERLQMNSGFYPEEYNEVFRQLLLSEQVWIDYEDQILPVNVLNGQIGFKKGVNEKLIDYNIEVEFAFDKVMNIR